jgi:ligand-binding sensor domain-containing protein
MLAMPHPEEHPVEELLAAFAEDSISPLERLAVLEHLSRCSECRQVVFLAQPELEREVAPYAAATTTIWTRIPAWRWAAAAACVLIVGAAVFFARQESRQGLYSRNAIISTASSTTIQVASSSTNQNLSSAPGLKSSEPQKNLATARNQPAPSSISSEKLSASAAMQAAAPVASERTQIAGAEGFVSFGPSRYEGVTNSNLPRWILTSGGLLERSLDAGKTWQRVNIAENSAKLHVVAAVGPHIWVGGSGGVLYHSRDAGQNWLRVKPSANGTELSDDVIAIDFSNALRGELRTSSGRIWSTNDGGQTWEVK